MNPYAAIGLPFFAYHYPHMALFSEERSFLIPVHAEKAHGVGREFDIKKRGRNDVSDYV